MAVQPRSIPVLHASSKPSREVVPKKSAATPSLERLENVPLGLRANYVREHEDWLATLSHKEMDAVAALLCEESKRKSRQNTPVVGDGGAQEHFEESVFGDDQDFSRRGDLPRE